MSRPMPLSMTLSRSRRSFAWYFTHFRLSPITSYVIAILYFVLRLPHACRFSLPLEAQLSLSLSCCSKVSVLYILAVTCHACHGSPVDAFFLLFSSSVFHSCSLPLSLPRLLDSRFTYLKHARMASQKKTPVFSRLPLFLFPI